MLVDCYTLIIDQLCDQIPSVADSDICMKELCTGITQGYPVNSPSLFSIGSLLLEERDKVFFKGRSEVPLNQRKVPMLFKEIDKV